MPPTVKKRLWVTVVVCFCCTGFLVVSVTDQGVALARRRQTMTADGFVPASMQVRTNLEARHVAVSCTLCVACKNTAADVDERQHKST